MKKKYIAVLFMLFFIGAFIYNIVLLNFEIGFTSSDNLSAIIGMGASLCGFIIGLTMFRFYQIKEKLDQKKP